MNGSRRIALRASLCAGFAVACGIAPAALYAQSPPDWSGYWIGEGLEAQISGFPEGGDYKLLWACAFWTGLSGLTPFALAFGLACGVQGLSALLIAQAAGRRGAPLRSRLGGRVPLALSIAAAGLYWSLLQSPALH